jgi:hypothetical protein
MRGVIGYRIPSFQGTDQLLRIIVKAATSMGLCNAGHTVIALKASKDDAHDHSTIMEIMEIEE